MKMVQIDAKGRLVIPKEVREHSGISAPGELLVTVEGIGKIGLQSAQSKLSKALQIGRRKLNSWRERKREKNLT
jgi:AbrB family looped-hinge helix DNA binding protein